VVIRARRRKPLGLVENSGMLLEEPLKHRRPESAATAAAVGCVEVGCRRLGAACHSTLRAPCWNVSVRASKSQVAGPSVRRKSTPRMKSRQPKSMLMHVMV
jgi:hypothetical protein